MVETYKCTDYVCPQAGVEVEVELTEVAPGALARPEIVCKACRSLMARRSNTNPAWWLMPEDPETHVLAVLEGKRRNG